MRARFLVIILLLVVAAGASAQTTNNPVGSDPLLSRVVEVAGRVEFAPTGQTAWRPATNGLTLKPGDRLRTRTQSRAAVQFSDRSVLRLSESTTLEIQPPRRAERRRFRLLEGLLFFFNREKPADVEFETPVVSGAIRGTEFVLEAGLANGATRLALLDGLVELTAGETSLAVQSGEQVRVEPGRAPVKSPLIEISSAVQWALYYPAVVNPDDLAFTGADRAELASALTAYRSGDLLAAQAAMSEVPPGGEARQLFRAALDLSIGRVDQAEALLARADATASVVHALREVIALVRNGHDTNAALASPTTASEWLARSYTLQARFELREALAAARRAAGLAPQFGFAQVRVAELEAAFEEHRAAHAALDRALELSPRLAPAYVLRGFIYLGQNDARAALPAFDRAIAIDAGLDNAWLGRGLAQMRLRQRAEALRSFQTAAALNPRRALPRSYLGKAYSAAHEAKLAEKDFRLAKELDPDDPTAWLYSALFQWQENRPNLAVSDLERSAELNDNEQVFRSRLLLDRDRAVRSANQAAIYRDAGLPEAGLHSAARAVTEDYANFSSHLFLANAYRAFEDPNRFDLRFETTRQSELLLANLLAPAGAGNLSQLLSEQEHLRYFDLPPLGVSTFTQYGSAGDWQQLASFFGAVDGLGYALDIAYESIHGTEVNDWLDRRDLSLQLKQRVAPQDEVYFQFSTARAESGDVARHYDPTNASPDLNVNEEQLPNFYLGWHHTWSAANHTLVLFSRLTDQLDLTDPTKRELYFRPGVSNATSVQTRDDFALNYESDFTLYSAEVQQIWQIEKHTLVAGARYQAGTVDSDATLALPLTGTVSDSSVDEPLRRANGYLYYQWHVVEPLRLIAGLSYDHLVYPVNSEAPPLTPGETSADLWAPKGGFLLTPWRGGFWHGAYSESLGGLFFDNSVRLEPTQVAGFDQAFRSLIPESTAGLVPGTEFQTASLGFDQILPQGTHFGLEGQWLASDGERTIGVFANPLPAPPPGSASSTRQDLEFREWGFSAYLVQLIGDGLSLGARYRLNDARLQETYPQVPDNIRGLDSDASSTLQQVALSLGYQHSSGFFAAWESSWYGQQNSGYTPSLPSDDFWHHNAFVGFRFPRRWAEIRFGVLNLTDQDYHLNPLNYYAALPRGRTAVVSLRLNF